MIIRRKANTFEKFDTEVKMPAVLNLQLWDNDSFSRDDFLGTASINISHFPQFSPTSDKCTMRKNSNYENLFAVDGSIRGWCPVYGKKNEGIMQTGKIEIELEVLPEDEAKSKQVGIGRDGPNALPAPKYLIVLNF
jgi:hypothetical protein